MTDTLLNISDTLSKIINVATGSEFDIIAEEDNLIGAIRFFIQMADETKVVFGFRFRVEPTDINVVNLPFTLREKYETVKWAKLTTSYGSIAGFINVDHHYTQAEKIMEELKANNIGNNLYDHLVKAFRSMHFYLSDEEFTQLFTEKIASLVYPPATTIGDEPVGVVVSFQGSKHKLIEGSVEILETAKKVPLMDKSMEGNTAGGGVIEVDTTVAGDDSPASALKKLLSGTHTPKLK
jgi:hypothetical protein